MKVYNWGWFIIGFTMEIVSLIILLLGLLLLFGTIFVWDLSNSEEPLIMLASLIYMICSVFLAKLGYGVLSWGEEE